MSEDKEYVRKFFPEASVVRVPCAQHGYRWLGSLGLSAFDKLCRSVTSEEHVWAQLKDKVNFQILRKLEQ